MTSIRRRELHLPVSTCAGLVALLVLTAACSSSAADHVTQSRDASTAATTTGAASTHAHDASDGGSSTSPTDLNGHHISGVKAHDVMMEMQQDKPLDRATRAILQRQLTIARAVAMKYPTVADATAAGYHVIAGFGPGSGAHYVGGAIGGMSGAAFDASKPLSLIYDGIHPTSQIVGLMYYAMGNQPPEGFAGPNDHWHRHSNVCTKFGPKGQEVPFPPDSDVTEQQCKAVGGLFMKITGWMVHAWVVPSWESPQGVFSHENPNLRCADGTFNTDAVGVCQGS